MKTDDGSGLEIERIDRVVITAAVRYLIGPSAVIRSIRAVSGRRDGTWQREGRLAIQKSHRMADPLIRAVR